MEPELHLLFPVLQDFLFFLFTLFCEALLFSLEWASVNKKKTSFYKWKREWA